MTIHIEELTFDCIIGILDFERVTSQKVIINVEIEYNYEKNNFINYADVIDLIEQQMLEKKYELLETAVEELSQKIVSNYSNITKLNLKISKPNIIKNAKVSLSKTYFSTLN